MRDWRAIDQQNRQKIADWLLALPRFAITRDAVDRTAAVEFARLLDSGKAAATGFGTFFLRTTAEVCQAVGWAKERSRISILRRLADRKSPASECLRTGVDVEASDAPRQQVLSRAYLWKSLPPSPVRRAIRHLTTAFHPSPEVNNTGICSVNTS